MITFPSTNYLFTVTFQGDAASGSTAYAYTLSRSMLRVKREDIAEMSLVKVKVQDDAWKTYYTDPQGVLEIPMQNAVNRYASAGQAGVTIQLYPIADPSTLLDQVILPLVIVPGVSYYEINAPANKQADQWLASLFHNWVLPPNVMVNPSDGYGIIAESNFHEYSKQLVWSELASGTTTAIAPAGTRQNQLAIAATSDTLKLDDGEASKLWPLTNTDACTDVVCIRWTSLTGAVRQHYFPIVSFLRGADETVSLVSPGNGYEVLKNAANGIRCRLAGLTAYGYWYYMDLLQASDAHAVVQVAGSSFETTIQSKETACYIEPNSTETPMGNGFFTFEFTAKLRHYDSF